MTLKEAIERLRKLGSQAMRERNAKNGASENQFGVKLGDIRTLANEIKTDHELALALWSTENVDARLLATLVVKPKALAVSEMDEMVRAARFIQLADWNNAYVVKNHPDKETLRLKWLSSDDPMAARAGWSLTAGRVARDAEDLDLSALLGRIEAEMADVAPEVQWTMNSTLAAVGIHHLKHRKRALEIGEKLGVYRDYPVSKGCTSPFAPIWIKEMVGRKR